MIEALRALLAPALMERLVLLAKKWNITKAVRGITPVREWRRRKTNSE